LIRKKYSTVFTLYLRAVPLFSDPAKPSVVILDSYRQGYEWSDGELAGLFGALRDRYSDLGPSIEYLDSHHFPTRGTSK
jgi:hypothetical protein